MPAITLESLTALVGTYGYFIIFPISVLEGPAIAVFSGALAAGGLLNPLTVFLVLLAGDGAGDFIYYAIGRWAKHGLIRRILKFAGSDDQKLEKMKNYILTHDWKIIFFSKTQALGSPFLIACGVAEIPFRRYIGYALLGSLPKVIVFESVGYFFGRSLANIGKYIDYAGALSFLAAVGLIVGYLYFKKRTKKEIAVFE